MRRHHWLISTCIASTFLFASALSAQAADKSRKPSEPAKTEAADDQSSEDLFGFTQGSDIAKSGEVGLSFELGGAFGRSGVTFRNLDLKSQIGIGLTNWLAIGPSIIVSNRRFMDETVPISTDRTQVGGAALEMRLRLLDRRLAPVGLTLTMEPGYSRLDDVGQRTQAWGVATKLTFDRGFADDAFILGGNLIWEPGWEKAQGATSWARSANTGFGFAGAFRVMSGVYAGVEARQLWSFDSLGLAKNTGQALFVGPNLFAQLSERVALSVAWNAQVSGQAKGTGGSLDLTNFERHTAKAKLAISF